MRLFPTLWPIRSLAYSIRWCIIKSIVHCDNLLMIDNDSISKPSILGHINRLFALPNQLA